MKKIILIVSLLVSFSVFAKPTAVLFDCDGVLVDTEYMKFVAWQKALKPINIDFTIEDYMHMVGESSETIAKMIMQEKSHQFDAPTIIAEKNAIYKQDQTQGVPPIRPAVRYLNNLLVNKKKLGLKIAIVSSDSREAIIRNLQFAKVKYDLLDGIFSGSDDLRHIQDPEGTNKPKPYIYALAAEKLSLDPHTTVVFEDTNAGVLSATSAGMIVIAMPNEFTHGQDFSKAKEVTSFKDFTIKDLEKY